MLKRTKELVKTVETQAARIEALEAINQHLACKVFKLETTVLKQKIELQAKDRINNINLGSLWDERRKNTQLEEKLRNAVDIK